MAAKSLRILGPEKTVVPRDEVIFLNDFNAPALRCGSFGAIEA